jgi:hypothetical protein
MNHTDYIQIVAEFAAATALLIVLGMGVGLLLSN